MTIDSATPIPASQPKKGNCFLWGCLIVLLLIFVTVCCLGSLIFLPFFTDFNPLGFDLKNQIEELIPFQDFLDDPSQIPGFDQFLDENLDTLLEEVPGFVESTPNALMPAAPASDAHSVPLETYTGSDFPATFSYPAGWEIETEDYAVTFYDPDSYTYLFVGEDQVDEGTTAMQISLEVKEALMEEAEEGTFRVVENAPYYPPTGDDAYLSAYEWTDSDGYFIWAFELETVNGDSNLFFFFSGENPDDAALYRDLIEIIADSYRR